LSRANMASRRLFRHAASGPSPPSGRGLPRRWLRFLPDQRPLLLRLLGLRRRWRLGAAFERIQAAVPEQVGAGPLIAHVDHGHAALAVLTRADIDGLRRADRVHDLTLGHV